MTTSKYMAEYRKKNPEYYELEKMKNAARYYTNPEYHEKNKKAALARYYRLKEAKNNNIVSAS